MRFRLPIIVAGLSLLLPSCGSPAAPEPSGTHPVRETLTGTIGVVSSTACSAAFQRSVDPGYYAGGTQRCVEFPRSSATGGVISARLTWQDPRIDLDLVLNDGAGSNFRQSIAANRCCETIEFVVNGGTSYAFVIYLRGVDAQFLANGGTFSGQVSTPFTLEVERPS
jgi:hypothetical protein